MTEGMQIHRTRGSNIVQNNDEDIENPKQKPQTISERMERREESVSPVVKIEGMHPSCLKDERLGKFTKDLRRKSSENRHDGRRKSNETAPGDSSGRRGSLGRPQIKIPYLAQIERRISMDLLDYSGKMEGLKLIRELNRETTHYRSLVVSLGGSSDCEQLRDDLRKSRQRSLDLVRQAKTKILPCLQEPAKYSASDRKEAKRLCKILYYCISVLEQELVRSLALQSTFTLHLTNQSLINTGVHEYTASHKSSPPAQSTDQNAKDKLQAEKNEILTLQKESQDLKGFIGKNESSPGVKSWTLDDFGDRQYLSTILEDSDPSSMSTPASPYSNQEVNASEQESPEGSLRGKIHHRRCLCFIFSTLLITISIASLLGALISFLKN